jgi:hypothetical protein
VVTEEREARLELLDEQPQRRAALAMAHVGCQAGRSLVRDQDVCTAAPSRRERQHVIVAQVHARVQRPLPLTPADA